MIGRLTLLLALTLLLPGAAAGHAAPPPAPDQYRVARQGVVLVDREVRAAELAALPEAVRDAWCGPRFERWRSHKAVTKIRTPEDEDIRTDDRSEPFAWTIMNAAAAALGQDDPAAREALIGNLRRWAKGEALTKLQDRHENTYYAVERTLLPTIVAYSLIRPHPDLATEERKLIERWLNRLVRLRGVKRPEETHGGVTVQNNHRYLRDAVDMAWGAYRGNDRLFRKGVESYLLALGQMRADGSLPLETDRGARALWYQRHALASLVAIAEMAAVQGYDLYAVEVEGRTLHDGVGFLARALDEPALVWEHAAANVRPGPYDNYRVQDLGFMARRGHGRHYMAWLEAYRARFPARAAGQRLWRLLAEFDRAPRPMIDEYAGGNATCFFARPE